jgi:Fic family protein
MVSIVKKKINGKEYLYLVNSIRKGRQVIQKTIKYIGKKRPISKEEFDCMKMSYMGEDWILDKYEDRLSYQDHEAMKKASTEYTQYINRLDKITKEKEREKFLSIFISNSNAIEGSTLTAKETFDYLFKDTVPHNHSKKELYMASNLLDAWNYVDKNHNKFPDKDDLINLHNLVNKGIESSETLGKFKPVQNYIGDVYTTSYLFTEERIDKLLGWIRKAFRKIDEFEVAFQSHAQFEIIHPFIDGNGRVGRLLLNWLLIFKGLNPLAIDTKKRNDYIQALNNSSKGKIGAICKFCFKEYLNQYDFI